MEERKSLKIKKEKNQIDLFDQLSKNFNDLYEGKGSFMEYAKSKEEEVTKIKDDIFSLVYGPGYKENLNAKKNSKKSTKKQIHKPKINIPTNFNFNLNNTSSTSKNAKNEEIRLTSEHDSGLNKTENSLSKPTSMEKRNNNTLISSVRENLKLKKALNEESSISPLRKSQIKNFNKSFNNSNNNNLLANSNNNSNSTNAFSSTKSNNMSVIKKKILSPIKEAPVKLIPLRFKIDKLKLSNESSKNSRNKTFSKIILNPIKDHSTLNSNINKNNKSVFIAYNNLNSNLNKCKNDINNSNKIQDEKSIIAEEPIKTKESDIFHMTQHDEKRDTKTFLKKNANNVSMNTNSALSEKGANESESKFFSKINGNNHIINGKNNNNDILKKSEINTFKDSNSAIDMSANGDNNNNSGFFSPEASTKYISINQSSIINNNFNLNNNNNFSSTNIFINNNNNNNNNNTILNKLSRNLSEIESLQRKSQISLLYPEHSEKGKELIEKIEQKVFVKKVQKYPLIPDLNKSLKFKGSNPLKTLFFNCSDNLNITNKLLNHIGTQKNIKLKSKTIEKLKKKEREFYVEKDLKLDMTFKDKVFVYGENGGYYISADFGHMQKYNLISKISGNLAMNNRHYLSKQFDYDYKADEDYIYQNELREKYLLNKKEEKEKEQDLLDGKHRKVEDYVENTLKKSEIFVQRIDNNLLKYEKEKNRYVEERENKDNKNSEIKGKSKSLVKKKEEK